MEEYSGEKFLDELYENYFKEKIYIEKEYNVDLKKYKYVRKNYKNKKEQYEDVRKYLSKLEKVHSSKYKETIKDFYYEEYIAKNEKALKEKIKKQYGNIPEESLQEAINVVINAQKVSLDKWIDYLSNDAAYYPVWAKYWAFQGMLKMGAYDEGTSSYQKRTEYTEAPFVDANPEIIAKAIEIVVQKVHDVYGDKNPSNKDIEKLKQEVNFSKLYAVLEKKYVNNVIEYSGTEGIWKKYNQGSKEEALRLNKELQFKNTHWCTASSESIAIDQICGPYTNAPEGGDFYVYYTKDKEGNYTLPRIAIRMRNHDEIGEIRGILDGQNMEEEMTPILEKKLNEMTFLTEESKEDAFEKLEGLRELTRIYQKTTKKEDLTEEELNHLYTRKYGFGWTQDPKVETIINKRDNVKDFDSSVNNEIKIGIYENLKMNQRSKLNLTESFAIYYLKTKKMYDIIGYIKKENISNYNEFAKLTFTLCFPSHDIFNYIKKEDVTNYDELAKMAVNRYPFSINYIKKEDVTNYDELAKIAITYDGGIIGNIKPKDISNYEELAKLAVTNIGTSIKYINPEDVTDYDELAKIAIKSGALIQHIKKENVTNYDELAKLAIKETEKENYDIDYIDDSILNFL